MKRKLVKCVSRAYSELIRSDIPGSSGVRPARLPFLRSSPLSVMKRSVHKSSSPFGSEPLTTKPIRGELRFLPGGAGKEKEEHETETSELAKGLPPCSGQDPKGGGLSLGGWGGGASPWRFSLSRSGVPHRGALLPLLQCRTR